MAVLVTKWFGVFVVENGKVTREKRFPATAVEIATRLRAIRAGKILDEERALAGTDVEVTAPRLSSLGRLGATRFVDAPVAEPDAKLLHEAALIVGRDESRAAAGEPDRFVAHAVKALEDLTTELNTLTERLREWYGLHYPEAVASVPDSADFVRRVAQDPHRERIAAGGVSTPPADSIGDPLDEAGLAAIQSFAQAIQRLHEERARLEKMVAERARVVAPNLARTVGDIIAAKLIARAGSLEELALSPASTVQTLGAETALFAHLKDGTKPPKHGVLFQHSLVNTAPKWQRGRFARSIAAAALKAARIDHFGKMRDASAPLKEGLEANVKRIRALKRPAPRVARREASPWARGRQDQRPRTGRPSPRGPRR